MVQVVTLAVWASLILAPGIHSQHCPHPDFYRHHEQVTCPVEDNSLAAFPSSNSVMVIDSDRYSHDCCTLIP